MRSTICSLQQANSRPASYTHAPAASSPSHLGAAATQQRNPCERGQRGARAHAIASPSQPCRSHAATRGQARRSTSAHTCVSRSVTAQIRFATRALVALRAKHLTLSLPPAEYGAFGGFVPAFSPVAAFVAAFRVCLSSHLAVQTDGPTDPGFMHATQNQFRDSLGDGYRLYCKAHRHASQMSHT
eukprot:68341-Chlamydomonas_euryale.AAC.1